MKHHPGIWMTLYIIELWFWYNLLTYRIPIINYIAGTINFIITSFGFYIITVYHIRWLEKIDNNRRLQNDTKT